MCAVRVDENNKYFYVYDIIPSSWSDDDRARPRCGQKTTLKRAERDALRATVQWCVQWHGERRRWSGIPLSSGLIRKRVWHTARHRRRSTSKGRARVPVGVVRGGPFGEIPRVGTAAPAHGAAAAADTDTTVADAAAALYQQSPLVSL